jgi:putative ABC transport system permease protein
MYGRMIARDFARNRGITVMLVAIMMLSVMLATASAGTLARLIGASNSLLDQAAAPHVAQLHAGPYEPDELNRWLGKRPEVVHHQAMLLLGVDGANLLFDGEPQTTNIQQNSLVVPNQQRDLLLDLENRPITEVEPGTIVPPVIYQVEGDLEVGDNVTVTAADGFTKELTVTGFARDSIMNAAITSSKRLAVAPADLEEVRAHTGEVEYLLEFWLEDPGTQSATFEKAYLDSEMPKSGQMVNWATFQLFTMVGDGMVAAVVVLVALLLLVIGLLCLRFSFLTATEQEYRELGVLKAIGVSPRSVKKIYLTKYVLLAAVASVLGLLGGFALTPVLTRNIARYMGTTASTWYWVVPGAAAVAAFVALLSFVVVLLHRFNKISAVTALRAGATGRQSKAVRMRLHRSRMPVHFRLGVMDVLGRWPTYLLLFFVFTASAFIMIVPINSATTANAPGFINYMGVGTVDLRIDLRFTDDSSTQQYHRAVRTLRQDRDVAEVAPMVTTRNETVDSDGNSASLYVENGDHTSLPLTYADGRAPTASSEIAMSLLALHQAGREVGATLPVRVDGKIQDLTIVGSYQDVTNGGKTAKAMLPTDADEVMWFMIGVKLEPGADPTQKAQEFSGVLAPAKVADIGQWRDQTLGPIAEQILITAIVSAAVAVALALLMTTLFTRMLLARDAGQIAIQRAIGADDGGLRRQYLTRLVLVLALGVTAGTIAANTVGERLFNLMFEGMFGGLEALGQGTSRIDFAVNPLLAYLVLPLILLAAVSLATTAGSRSISDTTVATLTTE